MGLKADGTAIALLVTLVLFGVASFWPLESMWGINHLRFAPEFFTYAFAIVCLIVTALLLWPQPQPKSSEPDRLAAALWGRQPWLRLGITAGFVLLFYLFRTETHFLGDGYGWLSILGSGEGYYHKWTEPGSIFLIRKIQVLLGGFTKETALLTFRGISIISGAVFVYASFGISRQLCQQPLSRLLTLLTLLGSGVILMFFGYVEFYHMLWAAVMVMLYAALRFIESGKGIALVVLAWVVALLMHMQSMYFAGGILFLLGIRLFPTEHLLRFRLRWIAAFLVAAAFGIIVFGWLYTTRIGVETTFLPLFSGRPKAPDYAVFSAKHLWDTLNLALVLFPGLIVLLAHWFRGKRMEAGDTISLFLGLSSIGSMIFLIVIDPTLGMARDWDLMSLTLLAPTLFVLRRIDSGIAPIRVRQVVAYAVVLVLATATYVSANTIETHSIARFHSLLRYYEGMSRGGWATLAYYYRDRGRQEEYRQISREMDSYYPEYRELRRVYSLLDEREYVEAQQIAERLVEQNPYEPDFLQVLGNIYSKLGRYELAEKYFRRTVELKPHHMILNEYGQLMMNQQKYDQALRIFHRAHHLAPEVTPILEGIGLTHHYMGHPDSVKATASRLFSLDQHSPGGHLLMMVTAIDAGDAAAAKWHLQQYLRYGKNRSDYERIKQYYNYLLELS